MKSIAFSTPMMVAWMKGQKTVTRRLMRPQPTCRKRDGKQRYFPGEVVFIREEWHMCGENDQHGNAHTEIIYKANGDRCSFCGKNVKWKSTRSMPEWASRSRARVVSVTRERIQDISLIELIREGIVDDSCNNKPLCAVLESFIHAFDSIYPGAWEKNAWVWRIELKKIKIKSGWKTCENRPTR